MRISDWSSDVCSSDLLVERNRFARIGVSSRRVCLPGRDGRAAAMGLAFVLHDSVLGKTARNRFAIRSIGGEIGGYGLGSNNGHGASPADAWCSRAPS